MRHRMTEPHTKHFPPLSSSQIWSHWEAEQRVGGMYCAGINASYSHHQTSSKCPHPSYSTFPTTSPSFDLSASPISDWLLSVLLCCFTSEECVRHLPSVLSGAVSSGTFRPSCSSLSTPECVQNKTRSCVQLKLHLVLCGICSLTQEIFHASGCKIVAEQNIMVLDAIRVEQWFPSTFLEAPQHCMFSMSP